MRVRLATAAALGSVALFALPSHAAAVTITDPKGDATPGGPATDITALSLQTVFKKKVVKGTVRLVPKASRVTLALAGPVDDNTFYSIDFTSTGTCHTVALVYDNNAVPLYQQNRAICDDKTPGETIDGPVGVPSGSKLVWQLPLSVFPVGTAFSDISATTLTGQVPAIAYDGTDDSSVTYTVGQK
jgi:hypothetical protein